jgi:hypothetical protein
VRLGSLGGRLLGEAGHLGERSALAVAVRATVAHEDECAAGAAQHDAQAALVEEPAAPGKDNVHKNQPSSELEPQTAELI